MKLGGMAVAGVVGLFACSSLVFVGIAFAGFAIFTALTPFLGEAGAAGVTAAIFLLPLLLVILVLGSGKSRRRRTRENESLLTLIARVARERPIVAVVGAALFGAAEVLLSSRRRK